jgi:hypothetical protein
MNKACLFFILLIPITLCSTKTKFGSLDIVPIFHKPKTIKRRPLTSEQLRKMSFKRLKQLYTETELNRAEILAELNEICLKKKS